ncbi:hypothetical protein AG0111_0g2978 [Alternaria gaisen]|uniref:Uncharacterized protein n=1 Tax=Alternaria gaisen TaxID=167740 RepID=A0ACB6FWP4_9PLEO|nr:hypothetical protein AG0111_0g2978 [Alternaria gaisen]
MPPSLNGPGPASPASFGFSGADLTAFTRRFEHFQQFEEEKTQFLAEIVTRYEYMYQQYQALAIERERDRVWVTAWKNEKVQYEKKHNHMLREMVIPPQYTSSTTTPAASEATGYLILIDGDGMIFCDKYLSDGEQGGRRAALDLSAAVQEYVDNECNDIPYGARIVCRIYANVRGLGDVLVRKGVYQDPSEFEKFVRGFTRGRTLFDFIDVGAGKDRADEKIIGLPSRFPPPAKSPVMDSPLPSRATMMGLPRTPSTSTLASDGMIAATKPVLPMNWAAKVAAPPPPVNHSSPTYKPANREEVIARNRAGQRIDPPCKDYDKIEVDRVKKIKMCNVHFLRNECPYEKNCTHLHAYKPTESEVATLRLVARMAPCSNGSGCQDIRCIYGHCCPAPHKTHHIKGTKNCIFGDSCKFPIVLHDIDTNVVKTLVIR